MGKLILVLAAASVMTSVVLAADPVLESKRDRISYAVGVDLVRNFRKQEVDFDADLVARGIRDALSTNKLLMPDKEMHVLLVNLQAEVRQKMAQTRRLATEDNRRRGAAYLEANKGKEGVVALASGLQYRVIKSGVADGRKPLDTDTVECNYRGTLIDGSEFDGTDPGKPASLRVSALIGGWREAVKLMPVGAKWQLVIPANLAYGERGVGSEIGPNETLLFEVELVAIK